MKRIAALFVTIACLSGNFLAWGVPETAREVRQIYATTGIEGGLVVHLGCGNGEFTASLLANDSYVVHGLDKDASKVAKARERIQSLGLYGRVSVDTFDGVHLPYVDNLVNLLVAEDLGAVSVTEVLRVLTPNGVARIHADGKWTQAVKPWPKEIDEWSHFLHDAGNNAVAKDEWVGPPRSIRWIAPPLWLRSHETPSGFEGMVSAGGRVFYFLDEGPIGITDQRLPERWSLVCRDAFNGKLLWKRPLEKWGWPEWGVDHFEGKDWTSIRGGRMVVPNENQRRLSVDGDRLYATLGYSSPLSVLDAGTGQILETFEETAPVREVLVSEGVAVVHSSDPASAVKRRRGISTEGISTLTAIEGKTGERLWEKKAGPIRDLFLAVDDGRCVFQEDTGLLTCLSLKEGIQIWQVEPKEKKGRTLVVKDGVVFLYGPENLEARDAATGEELWCHPVPPSSGAENVDLFVANAFVWRGMVPIDEKQEYKNLSAHAMAIGYDPRTGEEKKRIAVNNLRSPEHHHRCYRNKATERYIISAMEGAEFMDLQGEGHSQNNWLRGACRYGVMPCNGLLYVPPDQCFCEPGAKILGFAALSADSGCHQEPVPDDGRLEKGEAYGQMNLTDGDPSPEDWPTYRHDPARHGSTSSFVPPTVAPVWRVALGDGLTAPVSMGGKVYVASSDSHVLHALDAETGQTVWRYTAGGRIDSPPTLYKGLLLFGSADGRVYCLRDTDGALVWRFLAAPSDRRIVDSDQLESVWPLHGSVLVHHGVAYFTAGRSTYLDGGIHAYGLDPFTGAILHKSVLEGPFPEIGPNRDVSFYVLGANSDILTSEGDFIYMRQKRLTPSLEEVKGEVLSTKGEMDIGLHVFSTSGLLDGSWYNRTFWMYSKRWPGFQLANQAPKSGQLLVVDEENTYGVKVFYRRNVHSTMFFPGKEGYLLFADRNDNEPQIVGEEGARTPVAWLPQSEYDRGGGRGIRTLDSEAFGLDKMIGYTRAEPPLWAQWFPVRIRAMVKAGGLLFVAGPPDKLDPDDPYAAFEGRLGSRLLAISADDGKKLAECEVDASPLFDGLIAANGRLYLSLEDGSLACFAAKSPSRASQGG